MFTTGTSKTTKEFIVAVAAHNISSLKKRLQSVLASSYSQRSSSESLRRQTLIFPISLRSFKRLGMMFR